MTTISTSDVLDRHLKSFAESDVDGLVGASPTGCLITEHRAAVDAVLFSEYGR